MRELQVPATRQPRRTDQVHRGAPRRLLPLLAAAALSLIALSLPSAASADISICSAGSGAGKCENPQGLAVDFETGRLYVADAGNNRVDVFEPGPGHEFAFAFGWGVANGAPELQSCGPKATPPTVNCLKGLGGGGAGALGDISELAVDNEPASPSHHELYVLDGRRIQKFDDEGNFILTFGGGVISGGATGTGNLSSGSAEIKSVQTTSKSFMVGQTITGAGIPPETKIVALGAETITLSKPATAAGTAVALSVAEGVGNVLANEVNVLTNDFTQGSPDVHFTTPNPSPSDEQTVTAFEAGIGQSKLPREATAAELQAAIEGLPNVGAGNVKVNDVKVNGNLREYTIEFTGARFADTDVTLETGPGLGQRRVIVEENGSGAAEICTAAIAVGCSAGVQGDGGGQFSEFARLAVGPGGAVYVVDCIGTPSVSDCKNRLQKFEPSGAFIEEMALPQTQIAPEGLAVDSSGDFYVSVHNAIRKYSGAGGLLDELAVARGIKRLALDASDDLFSAEIENEPGGAGIPVIAEYDPSGNTLRRFGYKAIGFANGLAPFASPTGDLYTAESGGVSYRSFPPPGPLVVPEPCKTSFLGNSKATLLARVNPEGKATTVHFQYVDQKSFETEGGFASPNTKETAESASIGEDFFLHDATGQADLVPETKYHCRVIATNADAPGGVIGEEGTFTSKAPLEIGTTTVSGVGTETATLNATVNPLGISASGYFEYVEEATYLKDIEELGPEHGFDHAAKAPDVDASEAPIDFGSGESLVLGSTQLTGLKPGTAYRFRIVATDIKISPEGKRILGPAKGFRTFGAAPGALPDQRAWELVSPGLKNSAEVAVPGGSGGFTEDRFVRIQAAGTSGEAVTYTSWTSFGKAEGAPATSQYLSERGETGWQTESISPFGFMWNPFIPPFSGFSPDLRFGAVKTTDPVLTPDCREGLESLYLRDNETGEVRCLSLDTPGAPVSPCLVFAGASEDGSRAFFAGPPEGNKDFTYSLYEWSEANGVRLASVLPGGAAAPPTGGTAFGPGGVAGLTGGVIENCQTTRTTLRHAISADGSRAFWTFVPEDEDEPTHLYARVNGSETIELDKAANVKNSGNGVFRAASADGSVVYFTSVNNLVAGANPEKGKPDLYRYQFGVSKALTLTDLTKGTGPGDVKGVVGASDDGAYVYFVAGAVLTEAPNEAGQKAEAGKNNLYVHHDGVTSFIATLATEDTGVWTANPRLLTARVSPDGRHLAFLSIAAEKLAGYENTIAAGEHCQNNPTKDGKLRLVGSPLCSQAFLYSAESGELTCASCNPSGARPLGPTVIPGWTNPFEGPRFLSDDGQRLFFQSFDVLLPADVNGKGDVYEFERPGTGSCDEGDPGFDPASGGCHFLLSSGQSTDETFLVDASADGRDVFISTRQRLTGWDENDNYDVYDVREGGGFPEPPPAPPICAGEGCKAPPPPVPSPGQAPTTQNFQGPGNEAKPTSSRCPKSKARRKGRCVKSRSGKSQRQKHRRAGGNGRAGR